VDDLGDTHDRSSFFIANTPISTTLFYKSSHFLVKLSQQVLHPLSRKKIAASAPGVVYWVQTVLFFQTIHLKFTAFSNSRIKIELYTDK
jgi:hypothetical protein